VSIWEPLKVLVASLFGVLTLYVVVRVLFAILDCFVPEERGESQEGKAGDGEEARDTLVTNEEGQSNTERQRRDGT
jgi:hypothetical protein